MLNAFRGVAGFMVSSASLFLFVGGLNAASFTYQIAENLPCGSNCTGSIGVAGTITVDQLGSLGLADFTAWNLSIGNATDPPVTLTQNDSTLLLAGAVQVVAAADTLAFTITESTEGFQFSNNANPATSWIYGDGGAPTQLLLFPVNGQTQIGFEIFTLPSTLTLERLGSSATPEPATCLMMGLGMILLAVAARKGKLGRR